MSKLNSNHGFISLLYSIGDNPLELWSKYVSLEGRVRRIEDETLNGDRVIEIRGPDDSTFLTNISCPANPIDSLNIKLPVLVIIMKNLKARFRIDFQLIDEEGIRRKFFVSTYELSTKSTIVENDTARIILKLEKDWNHLEIDLRTWCQTVFRTEYKALQRLIIYQNCRLRRVYFQDRHYETSETPIQLCQAFFDMYLLKWGIHFVDKDCQTSETCTEKIQDFTKMDVWMKKIDDTQRSLGGSASSKVQGSTKSLPSGRKLSNTKKSSSSKLKNFSGSKENFVHVSKSPDSGKKPKIQRAETAKRKKTISSAESSKVGRKISSASGKAERKGKSEEASEGEIFRKWPYNYLQLDKIETKRNKLKTFSRPNSILGQTRLASLEKSLNRPFPKIHLPKISIEIPIPAEVEREAAAAEAETLNRNIFRTRSKLLTTDEAVHNYLELRHVVNRKMLASFQSRGLTMTEVELSIYNSKNRQNSYGQGNLVKKGRTSVEKACEVTTEKRETT